jgi:hypothetical protein
MRFLGMEADRKVLLVDHQYVERRFTSHLVGDLHITTTRIPCDNFHRGSSYARNRRDQRGCNLDQDAFYAQMAEGRRLVGAI